MKDGISGIIAKTRDNAEAGSPAASTICDAEPRSKSMETMDQDEEIHAAV